MTNTVFPTFQTQYIVDFSSAIFIVEHWDLTNTEIFKSKDVASDVLQLVDKHFKTLVVFQNKFFLGCGLSFSFLRLTVTNTVDIITAL
jgi:hypothetical protein